MAAELRAEADYLQNALTTVQRRIDDLEAPKAEE